MTLRATNSRFSAALAALLIAVTPFWSCNAQTFEPSVKLAFDLAFVDPSGNNLQTGVGPGGVEGRGVFAEDIEFDVGEGSAGVGGVGVDEGGPRSSTKSAKPVSAKAKQQEHNYKRFVCGQVFFEKNKPG